MSAARRIGPWRVWLADDATPARTAEAWLALADHVAASAAPCHRSKHATTHRASVGGTAIFLKRYRRYRRRTDLKDLVRPSKARHAQIVSTGLAAAGFRVPRVLAAAEERRGPVLRGAWLATAALDGAALGDRLAALASARGTASVVEGRVLLARKRRLLAALGAAVARLHDAGFIAGDLVPANVWIVNSAATVARTDAEIEMLDGDAAQDAIAFLDHDRTQRGRGPARWSRARRNLVQLNRLAMPGVVATDRLRVFRAYAQARGFDRVRGRRRLAWVIAKTIERRRRFDGIADAASLGFRALMRAPAGDGGVAAPARNRRPAPGSREART